MSELFQTKIILIVATDSREGIGYRGNLPWRCPEDMKRFKERTMGAALIMGRTTYNSIGKPLPGRSNHVISRNIHHIPGAKVHSSPLTALEAAKAEKETIFIIGGSSIYAALAGSCNTVERTIIPGEHTCDAFLPKSVFDGFHLDTDEDLGWGRIQNWSRQTD